MMLPDPAPILWAPRLRHWLNRWLTRMDRRKARRLAADQQTAVDFQWRAAYTRWWNEHGWQYGAPLPEQAFHQMRAARAEGRPYDPMHIVVHRGIVK